MQMDVQIVAPTVPATQGWPDSYAMGGTSPILAMEPFIIAVREEKGGLNFL